MDHMSQHPYIQAAWTMRIQKQEAQSGVVYGGFLYISLDKKTFLFTLQLVKGMNCNSVW